MKIADYYPRQQRQLHCTSPSLFYFEKSFIVAALARRFQLRQFTKLTERDSLKLNEAIINVIIVRCSLKIEEMGTVMSR